MFGSVGAGDANLFILFDAQVTSPNQGSRARAHVPVSQPAPQMRPATRGPSFMALFSWLASPRVPCNSLSLSQPHFSLATCGPIYGTLRIRFQSMAPFSRLAAPFSLCGLNRTVHRCHHGVTPALAGPSSTLTALSSLTVLFSRLPLAAPIFTSVSSFSQLHPPLSWLHSILARPSSSHASALSSCVCSLAPRGLAPLSPSIVGYGRTS
ncbi:hypothetical protein BOTBODRAFT_171323 [Botryobasidium botryosum FD-172 SS1]|uniref:Uncharacterized protein n=1 Tax=Botryobasidium botryosum (strain FD-172 SS1) TaxID=930990 RepID=A0A067N2X4_BOTB1|nr:hypothetical protein BOTBODRAFT_171323 [Botryobasidium botryosum FD-172 SS1]